MSKNVPKIRFPEFTGEWEEKKLGDTASYVKGYAFQSKEYKNKGIRVVRVSDTTNLSILPENNNSIYVDYKSHYEKYMLFKGDIIVSTVGSKPPQYDSLVGRAIYIDSLNEGSLLNQNQLFLKTLESYDSYFIYLNLKSASYLRHIISIIRGNANQASITVKELMQYPIKAPILTEQFKVADFLSTLDYRITNQSAKVDSLTELKKGIMQKIFSQEIRFKREDGGEYPDWDEMTLGEVSDVQMGQSPPSIYYNEAFEGYPLIQGNADISNRKTKPRMYTRKNTRECHEGDIIMSVRAPVGTIAISMHRACIGRGVCSIRAKESQGFIYQVLLFQESKWGLVSQGSTFESINGSDIRELTVYLPKYEEQQKIADFLSTIDSKIDIETQILSTLQTLKKGLLQQMFV